MTDVSIVGIKGQKFEEILQKTKDLEIDVAILDPSMVCGREHIESSLIHAERAFADGHNRSKTLVTELMLYATCERQVSNALEKMKPKGDEAVLVFIGTKNPVDIGIGNRDDSLIQASKEKLVKITGEFIENISVEDQILEQVAFVDLMKQ